MKLTISLLFLVATFVAATQTFTAVFMVDVLIPDLEAILKYQAKSNNTKSAYIDWPNSITFQVIRADDQYLKLDGDFGYSTLFSSSYSGLYYGNKRFHFKTKTGDMTPVKTERIVSYKQPLDLVKAAPYFSIKYFSLKEMQRNISLYYQANKLYFVNVLPANPATFLYMPSKSEGHFMEYIFHSFNKCPTNAKGILQVLIGEASSTFLSVKESKPAHRVVFDQRTRTLGIPKTLDITSECIPNVVGVRMVTAGYTVDELKSGQKIINMNDFHGGSGIPKKNVFADYDFMEKVRVVEPRLMYSKSKYRLLNEVSFQVKGHIFKKKINYLSNGTIDKNCPLLIKTEDEGIHIKFEGEVVSKLCTNDVVLSLYKD